STASVTCSAPGTSRRAHSPRRSTGPYGPRNRLRHRDLSQDARLDAVENLGQAVTGGGDAVVAQTDHGMRRIRLLGDEVGNGLGELLCATRVVHVGSRDPLHPGVHVEDGADVWMRLVDHPVLDRVDRDTARL